MEDLKDKLQQHIQARLTSIDTPTLTPEEEKTLKYEGIEEVIYKRMTSTKFRRKALPEGYAEAIKRAINLNVSKNQPLKFTHSFGAYKIWRVPSYPCADWAEFMSLAWYFKYASYICGAYTPGVEYQFLSQACCISQLNNYTQESLDKYEKSFLEIFKEFQTTVPTNLNPTFTKLVPDVYSQEEYEKDLEIEAEKLRNDPSFAKSRVGDLLKSFEFNTVPEGIEDLTNLTKEQLEERYKALAPYADGILYTPKDEEFEMGEDKVLVFDIFLDEVPNSIAIGSTAVSRTLHWAGTGIFEYDGERFHDRVLSPKQYEEIKDKLQYIEIDFKIGSLPKAVPVYLGRLDFLNR